MRDEFNEEWYYHILRRVRWPGGITCPRCGHGRVTTHSKPTDTPRRRYLCLTCRRTFTDLTGTPFARTNLPLSTWLRGLWRVGQGSRTSELSKELAVKWDTAVHMQRRLLPALGRSALLRQLREMIGKDFRG